MSNQRKVRTAVTPPKEGDFEFLGKRKTDPTDHFDIFPLSPAMQKLTDFSVKLETKELTSYCPVTEQPDFSQVIVEYWPKTELIETKSFKLYILRFRDRALFGEELAAQIANDIYEQVDVYMVRVYLTQQIRGGIQMKVDVTRGYTYADDDFVKKN